jgi:hypothetical protein
MQLRSGNILKSSASMASMNAIPRFTKSNSKNTNGQNSHIHFNYLSDDDSEKTTETTSIYEYETDYDDSDNESFVSETNVNYQVKTKPFDNTHPKYEEWLVTEILKRVHTVNKQTNILDTLRATGELTNILNEEFDFISKMPQYENFVTNVIFNKYTEIFEDIPKAILNQLKPEEIKEHAIFIFDIQNELINFNNRIQMEYKKLL